MGRRRRRREMYDVWIPLSNTTAAGSSFRERDSVLADMKKCGVTVVKFNCKE